MVARQLAAIAEAEVTFHSEATVLILHDQKGWGYAQLTLSQPLEPGDLIEIRVKKKVRSSGELLEDSSTHRKFYGGGGG